MTNSNQTKTKIDTVETRKEIGFPTKEGWIDSPAEFVDGELKIAGHPVMEDWEMNYMSRLAAICTKNGGRVLEVGYGLGLSASEIQKHNIDQHVIIECHPDVVKRSMDDLRDPISEQKANVLQGFWEDITPLLQDESFDGILFDTYPLTEEEIHGNHFWFFEEAYRLLKKGGVLTYYSDEVSTLADKHCEKLMEAGFTKDGVDIEVVKVNPPEDCEYWQHDTIVAPIVTKL